MPNPSDEAAAREALRRRIIGLGEESQHKTQYRELKLKTIELERYRALFERAHEGIVLASEERDRVVDANPTAAELLRTGRAELAAGALSALCARLPGLAEALAERGRSLFEVHLGGAPDRWLEVDASRVDIAGERLALVFLRDVSDRRRALEAMASAELRYRRLFEESLEGIFQIGPDGRPVTANPALARMLGFASPAEMLERVASLPGLCPDERLRDGILERLARGETIVGEEIPLEPPAGPIWVAMHARPVMGQGGALALVEGILEDVTQRRRGREATIQTAKMEAIGQLAGGVAHDFNNLLAVILGYAELALPGLEGRAEAQPIREIQRAAQRAADMTHQLLAFGRKQVLQPRVFDLGEELEQNARMLDRLLGERIDLAMDIPPVPLWIMADPTQITQVVVNLSVNARDAMPEGGVLRLRAYLADVAPSAAAAMPGGRVGRFACLEVSDTGEGISDEVRRHMFEPFFTTKAEGKGTGLGLATVHGIIQQSGGFLGVESAKGRGTTFRVFLPAAEAPQPAAPLGVQGAAATARGLRVLLAEDEEALRELLAGALAREGCRVDVAADGAAALRRLESGEAFDLLVTDAVMPGLNGVDLVRRARALAPGLPVVIMSGYAPETLLREPLPQGTRWLAKPVTPSQLVGAIRALAP